MSFIIMYRLTKPIKTFILATESSSFKEWTTVVLFGYSCKNVAALPLVVQYWMADWHMQINAIIHVGSVLSATAISAGVRHVKVSLAA